jgi:hypothetical protein
MSFSVMGPKAVKTTHSLRTPKSKYTVDKGDIPNLLLAAVHFFISILVESLKKD